MYMDITHNVNNYNIHLIPLLVLDDYQEGITVVYATFNMEDKVAISYTGVHIKLKCQGQYE